MATHHAKPNEIVDLETWAQDMPTEKTKVIAKTNEMELARLVLKAGKEFREHRVSGPITVHCVKGAVQWTAMEETQSLKAGQMVYLSSNESHSLTATVDSVVLLTIVFSR